MIYEEIFKEFELKEVRYLFVGDMAVNLYGYIRKLRNISIKIDPLYLQSIKKIATLKGIPYQTLVRQWLVKEIKRELKIA